MTIGCARPLACAGGIFVSSLALSQQPARAAPLTVRLEYAAEPGCPEVAEFKAVVAERLGRDPFVETAPEHVLVRIESRGRAMDGSIEWRDSSGKWTGDQRFPSVSTDCARLVRTMGFALAVQIQFLARPDTPIDMNAAPVERVPSLPPAPSAPHDATPPTQPIAPTPSPKAMAGPAVLDAARPPAVSHRPVFATGAGPLVGFGISSAPVLLGRLFGAVAWPHVSVELAAVASLPSTTRRADGAGCSQQHLFGSAAACATFVRWSSCLLGNAGEVRMTGENIDQATSASVVFIETGIRSGISQHLGRRALLNAHADGLINLTRWTARLDRIPVWTAPRFAAALGIDASVTFP